MNTILEALHELNSATKNKINKKKLNESSNNYILKNDPLSEEQQVLMDRFDQYAAPILQEFKLLYKNTSDISGFRNQTMDAITSGKCTPENPIAVLNVVSDGWSGSKVFYAYWDIVDGNIAYHQFDRSNKNIHNIKPEHWEASTCLDNITLDLSEAPTITFNHARSNVSNAHYFYMPVTHLTFDGVRGDDENDICHVIGDEVLKEFSAESFKQIIEDCTPGFSYAQIPTYPNGPIEWGSKDTLSDVSYNNSCGGLPTSMRAIRLKGFNGNGLFNGSEISLNIVSQNQVGDFGHQGIRHMIKISTSVFNDDPHSLTVSTLDEYRESYHELATLLSSLKEMEANLTEALEQQFETNLEKIRQTLKIRSIRRTESGGRWSTRDPDAKSSEYPPNELKTYTYESRINRRKK